MSRRSISYFSLLSFLASLHTFLTLYVNSSVVEEELWGVWFVTPVFFLGYLAALVCFFSSPRLLKRIGNAWYLVLLGALEAGALITLAQAPHGFVLFFALILHLTMAPLIGLSLDIFFERSMVREEGTGTARGFFLTSGNTALVLSPLIIGVLASQSLFLVYTASLVIFALFLLTTLPLVRNFKDPEYSLPSTRGMLETLRGPLGAVIKAQLVLRIFYSFAAVYMPLLLRDRGFSWEEIGIILGIALLPFMLFELPLGHAADKVFGEREVLILGCLILSGATLLLSYPYATSIIIYTAIFFTTRTGASMVEITTETNFFRNVRAEDTNAITLFRMTNSIGGLIGIALSSIALYFFSLQSLFVVFGVFVLLGIPVARHIKDSR